MRARWHTGRFLRVLAAPLLLGGVLTGLGSTAAAALTCQAWTGGQPADPGGTGNLSAVTMLSACNVWVAGVGGSTVKGLIVHWNGTRWLQSPSPNPGQFTQLTGVRAVSSNDAWAVGSYSGATGNQTLILHWDGTSWTQVPSPSPGPDGSELTGVTATSATDAWAVGDYISQDQSVTLLTLTLHWDGKTWKQVSSPSPGPVGQTQLTSVDATSPTDAWAVGFFPDGTNNQTLILHWDGASWTQTPSPNPADDDRLDSVAASSAGNAVAVGTGQAHVHGALPTTLALRWDGTAWKQAPSIQEGAGAGNFLLGVATISPTEAWAVGFFGPTPVQALAFHFK